VKCDFDVTIGFPKFEKFRIGVESEYDIRKFFVVGLESESEVRDSAHGWCAVAHFAGSEVI